MLTSQGENMYTGTLQGKPWQSVGLRSNGDRAILWGREIVWLKATEFETLKGAA